MATATATKTTGAKRGRKPRVKTPQQIAAASARDKADAAEAKFAETKSSADETKAVEARNVADYETQKERRENFERVFGLKIGNIEKALDSLAKACSGRKYLFVAEDKETMLKPIADAVKRLEDGFELALQRSGRSAAPRDRRIKFAPLPIAEPERPASAQLSMTER